MALARYVRQRAHHGDAAALSRHEDRTHERRLGSPLCRAGSARGWLAHAAGGLRLGGVVAQALYAALTVMLASAKGPVGHYSHLSR